MNCLFLNHSYKTKYNINKLELKKSECLIPKIEKYSPVSYNYNPSYLFTKDYYYCSYSKKPEQFIHFDFLKEYKFSYFKIICYKGYIESRP